MNFDSTKTFFQQVLKRPGMYVEKVRLDMVITFYHGWCMGRGSRDWDEWFDITHWLWKREGILHHCDPLSFLSLYFTYGVKELAIRQMRIMIEETPFTPKQTAREDYFNREKGDRTEISPLKRFDQEELENAMKKISLLIEQALEETNIDFLTYLFTDGYFTQVRIFRKIGETYQETTQEILANGHSDLLLKIHHYLNRLNEEEVLSFCILTLEQTNGQLLIQKQWIPRTNNLATINISYQELEEEYVLARIFERWKAEKIV